MQIRLNPEIFEFVTSSIKQCNEVQENCVESFSYSFFLDFVHPENSETELLLAIKNLIKSELQKVKESGLVSGLLHESFVLKSMLKHYLKKRNQRKYMRLIFKKSLRSIIHNQELIKTISKLDPRKIYIEFEEKNKITRSSMSPLIPKDTKDKKQPTRRNTSKKFEEDSLDFSPEINITTEDAMHNEEIYTAVVDRSFTIIQHCKLLLQGIYSNVDTMPFGLRWICKQLVISIDEILPNTSDQDKFTLLGNILFTNWWIPAIIQPTIYGLLQNMIVQQPTMSYLITIGTIIKHIFKQTFYEEFQYFKINEFIADENIKMQNFLKNIINFDEDRYINRARNKIFSVSVSEMPYEGNNKTMHYYYHTKLSEPQITGSNIITKSKLHMEDEKNMKKFKIITFVVSLSDIKFLAKLIEERKDLVTEKNWLDLLRYAKTVKNSDETNILYQPSYLRDNGLSEKDELYFFFIKRDFGEYSADIENSYMASLKKSKIDPGSNDQLKLLTKVQDAIRSLLISLDMSIFFDPSKEWSLIDIVEFVIHFSYLFENKKTASQDRVPLKLIAQFLSTYLKDIPNEYVANSYRKLYIDLLKDYEERYEHTRDVATRNKKLLLLSINFMEKHNTDIRQEVKTYETLKQKSFAVDFIKRGKVPACLLTIKENSRLTTQVFSQTSCPHSKLTSVNEFVLGARRSIKNTANVDDTHVTGVQEFYVKFMNLDQVAQSTLDEDDQYNVSGAFFDYLSLVKEVIRRELASEDDVEMAMEEIESYITSSMFDCIFPSSQSDKDSKLYNRTLEHDWIKPEHLDIVQGHRNGAMWKFAIEALKGIDNYGSPADKLDCFVNCMSIIVNVLSIMNSSGSVGTDDSLPIIIYVMIKAQPNRMHSNLNYISKFRHQSKMIGLKGFVFQQFQSAASFIEYLDSSSLTISHEDYVILTAVSRDKFGLDC